MKPGKTCLSLFLTLLDCLNIMQTQTRMIAMQQSRKLMKLQTLIGSVATVLHIAV